MHANQSTTSPDVVTPVILARVASGDATAVRDCVALFGGMIWTLAMRWSPTTEDAEDATQEIFFDLWRSAARYDATKATERGFVAMLARRRLIDRARRRQRELPIDPMPDAFDVPSLHADESERLTGAMDAEAVLARLTPTQRQLISLNLLDGMTHDEIARETSLPLGTVKSHIRRGLLKARALLTGNPSRDEGEDA